MTDVLFGEDYSHYNNFDLKHIKNNDKFVWLKGTQGIDFMDPSLADRKILLNVSKIPIGIYHFLTGDNPQHQFNYFILNSYTNGDFISGLDLERNVTDLSNNGTLSGAAVYAKFHYQVTGVYPILYCSATSLGSKYMACVNRYGKAVADKNLKILMSCLLWNVSQHPIVKPDQWKIVTFNQYAIKGGIDQNEYFGNQDQLQSFWFNNTIKIKKLDVSVNSLKGLNQHKIPQYTGDKVKALNNGDRITVDLTEQETQVYGFNTYHWIKIYNQDLWIDREYLL